MCRDVHHEHCECPGFRIGRFLQPCLLLLLFRRKAHGYELIEELQKLWFEGENLDPGLVYRTLRRLEEDGFVSSEWVTEGPGPARRVYALTEEGRAILHSWAKYIKAQIPRLQSFLARYRELEGGKMQ